MIITITALVLLVLRFVATFYLVRVLLVQWSLMKLPLDQRAASIFDEQDIIKYRRQLFLLTFGLAASNALPIVFDLYIIGERLGLSWLPASSVAFLVVYTVSNAMSSLLSAFLISKIYRNALEVDKVHADSDHKLMNE